MLILIVMFGRKSSVDNFELKAIAIHNHTC